jgi:hypothetical protein
MKLNDNQLGALKEMVKGFKDAIKLLEKDQEWSDGETLVRKHVLDDLRGQKSILEDEIDQHVKGKS